MSKARSALGYSVWTLSFLWTPLGGLSDTSQVWVCSLEAVEEQTHFPDLVNLELVCPDAKGTTRS